MELTKRVAKMLLEPDFIPGGERIDVRKLAFRPTRGNEVYRCGRQTGGDSQSGPIYCGNVAEEVAFTENGRVALCERHPRHTATSVGVEKIK